MNKQTTELPRRKNLLVEKSMQLELIAIITGTFIAMMLLTLFNFTSFLSTILPNAAIVSSRERIIIFIVSTFLIIGIAAVFLLVYTHRIIGPLPRLEREIRNMVEAKKYHNLGVREKDKLKSFISTINLLIKEINEKK